MISLPLFQTGEALVQVFTSLGTEGVVTALLGSTVFGAIVKALIDKYKPKVDRTAAENSEHERASGMSLALAEKLQGELDRMGQRIEKLETKLDQETSRGNRLEGEVRTAQSTIFNMKVYISRVTDYWQNLEKHWDSIRVQTSPPKFPHYEVEEPRPLV